MMMRFVLSAILFAGGLTGFTSQPAAAQQQRELDLSACEATTQHFQTRQYGLAVSALTTCLRENPDAAGQLHFLRGLAFYAMERYGEALEDLNTAIDIDPDAPRPVLARANLHLLHGRYGDAVADYDYYATLEEQGPETLTALEAANGFWAMAPGPGTQAGRFNCREAPLRITTEPPDRYESLRLNGRHLVADVLASGTSSFVIRYINETRRTETGIPVVWLFYMFGDNLFAWRRADWADLQALTPPRLRCAPMAE